MTIARQSASSSEGSAAPDRTAAPATPPTRHRARPARKDQSPPPALSIRRTFEPKLRNKEESSPSILQDLTASYHSSSTQDLSSKAPSASAKNRGSSRLLPSSPAQTLGSGISKQTKAVRKATPKSSDQDPSSANSDGDNNISRSRVSAPVSQSPFLVPDDDHHNNNSIHDKAKARLFWTRLQNKNIPGLHAGTPSKSQTRQPIGEPVPPPRPRRTRSQALEADLQKKQVFKSRSTTAAGELGSDDGVDGDDEGSDDSDTQTFTDGDETPIPRTPSKVKTSGIQLPNPRPSKDGGPCKDNSVDQHIQRMRILGAYGRTYTDTISFKRRVAAVTGSGTDEDIDDPYAQEGSDGDKTSILRTPSKRMKQASDLQSLEARSPSSPGSWLERWKLNTMMSHSSMKPPKAPQEDIDPVEMLPTVDPSEALGFATPKRKRTVFLDNLDLAPSRPTIDGHAQGEEGLEAEEEEEEEVERNESEDNVAGDDVRTPVKTRPLRLDLAEMADLQTVTDQQQNATADFQTPPHKHVRKDLFGQNMRPPPAPRGLSSGHRPMYFENMGTSSPIAQKTLHLHRPPSEW
ncbi:hypothetical protein EC968_010112 [Mortierella alpina]|nr:hypothetical protein EC968_010112 [Mortierella alpina]